MFERLKKIEERYIEIEKELASPDVVSDLKKIQTLAQERSGMEDLVSLYRSYNNNIKTLEETKNMLSGEQDDEMKTMVEQEIAILEPKLEDQLQNLKLALLPKDEHDDRDIIVEIRAGTGGDEAGMFAADLFRMYTRYAQIKNWTVEIINSNETAIGCTKEVIFEIKGKGAFSRFKYERGVHRVQRIPTTESSGRIHTSTATIAVLPVAKDVEIDINPNDLRIDIFHSGGAGGQNVNKVATAVRITHLPTGMVAVCQDERSQHRNKSKAMDVMRARLLSIEQEKQDGEITEQRRSQVGSGERAEKIRTYNFPQDRITDHRIGVSMHNLPKIMEGELDDLIDAIATSEQARQLETQAE